MNYQLPCTYLGEFFRFYTMQLCAWYLNPNLREYLVFEGLNEFIGHVIFCMGVCIKH